MYGKSAAEVTVGLPQIYHTFTPPGPFVPSGLGACRGAGAKCMVNRQWQLPRMYRNFPHVYHPAHSPLPASGLVGAKGLHGKCVGRCLVSRSFKRTPGSDSGPCSFFRLRHGGPPVAAWPCRRQLQRCGAGAADNRSLEKPCWPVREKQRF